jgi:uncharacterized protein (TIGR03437 family)
MKPALRIGLTLAVFPLTAFADLTQTVTLSLSGQTSLNLDTGALSGTGGDIQFSTAGITPQGKAMAVNGLPFQTAAGFAGTVLTTVQFYPGYSTAAIPLATLKVSDEFFVHTNAAHFAKLLVTASTASTITLMFTTFGVTSGPTTGPPAVTAIQNNSSGIPAGLPNYGITPSSIFIIIGTGLADPGTPVLQNSLQPGGLPLTLNGASISVTVNGITTRPAIYYTSPTQIAAVLPASTPVGKGTLIVTYNGVASIPATIVVVPAALGINFYYSNSAVATDAISGALLTYTNSGTPGEIIVLWTTGLGADPADSDTTYTTAPHAVNTPLQIYIGGVLATILYQGSAGYPGVNQINVIIPASTPDGCWTGVAAVSAGVLSNITTIPVQSGGGICNDQVNGLSGNQLAPAPTQTLKTGVVVLTQTVRTSASGVQTFSTNSDGAFEAFTGIYSPTNPISPGGCIVNPLTPVSVGVFTGLDPGQITLTGPNALSITLANQLGIKGAFNGPLTAGAIPQSGGKFTFNGSGGMDVGSFNAVLDFANPLLSWTNQNVAATVDRSKDLKITWSGGNPGSYIFVTGSTSTVGFTCLAKADDGQFTVPSYILSAMPAGAGGMGVQNDIYGKLGATGLDIGLAQGEVSISAVSIFK